MHALCDIVALFQYYLLPVYFILFDLINHHLSIVLHVSYWGKYENSITAPSGLHIIQEEYLLPLYIRQCNV